MPFLQGQKDETQSVIAWHVENEAFNERQLKALGGSEMRNPFLATVSFDVVGYSVIIIFEV